MNRYSGKEISSMNSVYPQMRVLTNMYDKVEHEKVSVTKNNVLSIPLSIVILVVSLLTLDIRTSIEFIGVLFLDIYLFYLILVMTQLMEEYKYIKSNDYIINGINLSTIDELTKSLFRKEGYIILYNKIFKLVQGIKILIILIGIIQKILSYML